MRCDNCGWGNPDGAERCQKCNQVLPQIQQTMENDPLAEILAAVNKNKQNTAESVIVPVESQSTVCHKCGYPKLSTDENCPNCGAAASVAVVADNIITTEQKEAPEPASDIVHKQDTKATVVFGAAIDQVVPNENKAAETGVNTKQTVRDVSHIHGNMKATVRDFSPESFTPQATVSESAQSKSEPLKATVKSGVCLVAVDGLVEKEPQSIFCDAENMVLNRANVDSSNLSISEGEQAKITCEDGAWYIQDLSEMKNTYIRTDRKIRIEKGDMVIIGNRRYILQ